MKSNGTKGKLYYHKTHNMQWRDKKKIGRMGKRERKSKRRSQDVWGRGDDDE